MVELRKRKPRDEPAPEPPRKRSSASAKSDLPAIASKTSTTSGPPVVGTNVNVKSFGGEDLNKEVEITDLEKLLGESSGGVVLFTYPKASTPGCTNQVCLFRDDFSALTATGFSIYGLSRDSPNANTTFKTKQNLPYPLLCDPQGTLIAAIGMRKAPSGTTRGVFVIDKSGKVLAAEAGGPAATVEVVRRLVQGGSGETAASKAVDDKEISKEETKVEQGQNPADAEFGSRVEEVKNGLAEQAQVAQAQVEHAHAEKLAPYKADEKAENGAGEREGTKEDVEAAKVAGEVADTAATLDRSAVGTPLPTGAATKP